MGLYVIYVPLALCHDSVRGLYRVSCLVERKNTCTFYSCYTRGIMVVCATGARDRYRYRVGS